MPVASNCKSSKLATPLTAVRVKVPDKAPEPLPFATVILLLKVLSTELSGLRASTVNTPKFVAGKPTKASCVAMANTSKGLLVPADKTSPDVRVAVKVAPVPAADKVTFVKVMELFPAVIEPVVVPPIEPAFAIRGI